MSEQSPMWAPSQPKLHIAALATLKCSNSLQLLLQRQFIATPHGEDVAIPETGLKSLWVHGPG